MKKRSVWCLMGPTASGKTALACALYHRFPVDVISVDSALVYRGMDIGTAKPTVAEQAAVPHQLIDCCDPSAPFSAGQFCTMATAAISASHRAGRIPLLVGGTMLYFQRLQQGFAPLPDASATIREQLSAEAARDGWPALHARLAAVDPAAHARIHPHDAQRIQRALEVAMLTGQSITELQRQAHAEPEETDYHFVNALIMPTDRAILHARIAARLEQMFAAGFVDEVRQLRQRYALRSDLPSMRSVGYRQVWAYLEGELASEAIAAEQALFATRQLAKRQLTWLRRWHDGRSFAMEAADVISQVAAYFDGATKAGG